MKQSFAYEIKIIEILTRSFFSRFMLRYDQPFLAKLKLTINWSLYPQGLRTPKSFFCVFFVVPFNFLGVISISNWLILCFFLQEGGFFQVQRIIILKNSEAGNHFRSHSSSALDKKREEFFLDRNFSLFLKGEKSSQFKQRLASRALDWWACFSELWNF